MAVESPATALGAAAPEFTLRGQCSRARPDAGRKQPVADAPRALFEAVQRIGDGRLRRCSAMGRSSEWRAA